MLSTVLFGFVTYAQIIGLNSILSVIFNKTSTGLFISVYSISSKELKVGGGSINVKLRNAYSLLPVTICLAVMFAS